MHPTPPRVFSGGDASQLDDGKSTRCIPPPPWSRRCRGRIPVATRTPGPVSPPPCPHSCRVVRAKKLVPPTTASPTLTSGNGCAHRVHNARKIHAGDKRWRRSHQARGQTQRTPLAHLPVDGIDPHRLDRHANLVFCAVLASGGSMSASGSPAAPALFAPSLSCWKPRRCQLSAAPCASKRRQAKVGGRMASSC